MSWMLIKKWFAAKYKATPTSRNGHRAGGSSSQVRQRKQRCSIEDHNDGEQQSEEDDILLVDYTVSELSDDDSGIFFH